MWEKLLAVVQPEQAHASPLWRQAVPVRVLYKGEQALPRRQPSVAGSVSPDLETILGKQLITSQRPFQVTSRPARTT